MNYHFLYNSESDNSRCRPPVWGKRKPAVHDLRTAGLAEAVGFEPTSPWGLPDFESGPLWPLRYASVYVNPGFPEVDAYSVLLEFPLEPGGAVNLLSPGNPHNHRLCRLSASQTPAGFRVEAVMTTSILLPVPPNGSFIIRYTARFVNLNFSTVCSPVHDNKMKSPRRIS